jgi:fermentation-respiration switch protein FrsA (DUF1100 family)
MLIGRSGGKVRTLSTLLLAAIAVYGVLALLLYLFQERMVFLAGVPGRTLEATPADVGLAFDDVSIVATDGVRLHGWFVPAPDARATLLFLHGNAGNISHRLDSIALFHQLGLDVLIIDYRGYGQSAGAPSERGTYLDAQAAWNHLVGERGVEPGRIVVFGRSLGGAVAAWLASVNEPGAVIVESAFTTAPDIAQRLYPFLPARLLSRLKYPTKDFVTRLSCPLLVVHSRDDELIPFAMGKSLFEAAPEPKGLLEIRGDHNGGFLLSRERYLAGLAEFIDRHLGTDR